MLFAVTMDVDLPPDLDPDGQFANLSIFDVDSHEELHDILWNLPLFPYMTIEVTPLSQHPSDIAAAQ